MDPVYTVLEINTDRSIISALPYAVAVPARITAVLKARVPAAESQLIDVACIWNALFRSFGKI